MIRKVTSGHNAQKVENSAMFQVISVVKLTFLSNCLLFHAVFLTLHAVILGAEVLSYSQRDPTQGCSQIISLVLKKQSGSADSE